MDAWTEDQDDGMPFLQESLLHVVLPLKMKSSSNIVTLKKLLSFVEVNQSRQSLLFKNLLVCLDTLHSTGIFHGCINLDNIWIEDMFYVSLGPFCLPFDSKPGFLLFNPPEVVLADRASPKETLFKGDIWAVGLVFCVLRYGLNFADQLEMVSNEEDYLEFCEVAFDFDSQSDYSYVSYENLQKCKRRKGQMNQKSSPFDFDFLKSCREDFRKLILLQGLLHPEPQNRVSSKELLCANLFRDCQEQAFSNQKDKRQPTIETGSNRKQTPPPGVTKRSKVMHVEENYDEDFRPRHKPESKESLVKTLERGESRFKNLEDVSKFSKKEDIEIQTRHTDLKHTRDARLGHPMTPQYRLREELGTRKAIISSEGRFSSVEKKKEQELDGKSDYRAMRDRREAIRRELSTKNSPSDTNLIDPQDHFHEKEFIIKSDLKKNPKETREKTHELDPRDDQRNLESREPFPRTQLKRNEFAKTVPSEHLSSKMRHYDFQQDDDQDELAANFQASDTLNKHSYGYGPSLKHDKTRQHQDRSRNQRKDSENSQGEPEKRNENYPNKQSHQDLASEDKSLTKISKPFFNSSNSNILQDSSAFMKNLPKREIPHDVDKFNNLLQKIPQEGRSHDRKLLPPRRNPEEKSADDQSDRHSSQYVPKFDVIRRPTGPPESRSNGFDSKRRESVEGSVPLTDQMQDELETTGAIKYFKDPQTHFKPKPGPRNLTAIIKLSTVKLMEDSLEGYNFVSGSLVFKKSILEEGSLTFDTEIVEANQELALNSVFSVSLPGTKLDLAEEMRVDLTLYGHKEKSNFKRYLSSGCLDIRSAIISQLLGPNKQRAVENKWCLLRNTQRTTNAVVQVEVVVEEIGSGVSHPVREDSLEKSRSNQATATKRRREIASNIPKDDVEIQIKEEAPEISYSPIHKNRSRAHEPSENQRSNLRYSSNHINEKERAFQNREFEHQREPVNQAIKPNFSFGKIAGKPVQDQKEALKREIEDLRNSIDKADNFQEYPKALGLLRELINKGNSTNHSIEPN